MLHYQVHLSVTVSEAFHVYWSSLLEYIKYFLPLSYKDPMLKNSKFFVICYLGNFIVKKLQNKSATAKCKSEKGRIYSLYLQFLLCKGIHCGLDWTLGWAGYWDSFLDVWPLV